MSDPEQAATERSALLPPSSATSQTLVEPEGGSKDDDRPKQPVSVLRGFLVIISMAVLIFLQASNMSLLTTTQSAIAADLDSYSEASWFTSSYLIALSSVVPLAGRASQIFTPGACVFCGSVLMAGGAVVTASAPGFAVFLIGRVITGIGAACIFPVSILFVLELTSKKRRGLFIGLVNSAFTSGVALGAVVAGALAPALGWRAVFWLQIPLAIFAGASTFLSIPRSLGKNGKVVDIPSISQKLAKIDYAGMVTLISSLVLLLFGLASPKIPIAPLVVSFVILALFIVIENRYATDPIIPVTVLKSRGALFSCFATLGLMLARWTVLFYTPVYAIAIRGWSPASAGSMLVPTNAGFAFGGLMVGWIHVRKASSYYFPCLVVFALFSVTLFTISQISIPSSATPTYMLVLFCNGMCTGAALNYTLAHFLHITLPDTHVIGTAVLVTFRGFAGSIGVATAGGIFGRVLQASLESGFKERGMERRYLIQRLLGSPALVATLKGEERVVAVEGYTAALKAVFVVASALAAVMILVQAGAGWTAPSERKEEEEGGSESSEQRNGHVE